MGGGNHRACPVAQQHRQAVGHHDGAGQIGLSAHAGIGFKTIRRVALKLYHLKTVNLFEKNGFSTCGLLQQAAVAGDVCCVIAHMVTKVEAVPGPAGHTTASAGKNRTDIWRSRPVGNQPVGIQDIRPRYRGRQMAALFETLAKPCRPQTRPWCAEGHQN